MKKGAVYPVVGGFVALAWSELGVTDLVFPRPRAAQAAVILRERWGDWCWDAAPDLWLAGLSAFFDGEAVELSLPVDLRGVSSFGRRVLEAARTIPVGRVRTYGEVAAELAVPRGARAVGQALARNPVPGIIPCHRVVGTGNLGGYREGLAWKERLLDREGVVWPAGDGAATWEIVPKMEGPGSVHTPVAWSVAPRAVGEGKEQTSSVETVRGAPAPQRSDPAPAP